MADYNPEIPEKVLGILQQFRGGFETYIANNPVVGESIEIPTRSGKRHALIYKPENVAEQTPVLFSIHGGGFVAGFPEIDDALNKRISDELGIVVIGVSYRLAPEFHYPAPRVDVFDEISYVHDHPEQYGIDPERMAVTGKSAGGNLTTVMAIMAKETGAFSFKCAIADYPVLDMKTDAFDKELPEGCIPPELASAFDLSYRDPADGGDPLCSPLYIEDERLTGLPPFVIMTAEGDSLRGEGEEFAKKLMAAGVEVTGRRFLGVGHGFTIPAMGADQEPRVKQLCEESYTIIITALKNHLLA
jgi:acetyl esterase